MNVQNSDRHVKSSDVQPLTLIRNLVDHHVAYRFLRRPGRCRPIAGMKEARKEGRSWEPQATVGCCRRLAGRRLLRRTDNSGLLSVLGRPWLKPIQSTSLLAILVSPHEKNSDSREEDLISVSQQFIEDPIDPCFRSTRKKEPRESERARDPSKIEVYHRVGLEQMRGRKRALLVGCNYPGGEKELTGCWNDVRQMRHLLITRFGFQEADICLLVDDGKQTRPTWEVIREHLLRLIGDVKAGDVLVFHFSGHGVRVGMRKP